MAAFYGQRARRSGALLESRQVAMRCPCCAVAIDAPLRRALLEGLNPEQLAAVTLPAEPALILAGAGSGKTRVLTTRIAWLIQTGQLSPGGVLAVTFTNKAAKEMLTRLDAMLPIPVRGMWVGTFHGLCNRFLRAHWKLAGAAAGLPDPRLERPALGRQARHQGDEPRRGALSAQAGDVVHRRRQGRRPARRRTSRSATSRAASWSQVYEAYDAQCQREGVVDFAELMLRTYELMRDNEPLREHYQRRFRHILVDEFQDTNRLQYAWLKMFAGPPEHGCALFASATTTRASTPFAARRSATWRRSSASTASRTVDQARAQLPLATATSSTPPTS